MTEPTNAELATQLHYIANSIERCTELPIDDVRAIRLAAARLTQPVGDGAKLAGEMLDFMLRAIDGSNWDSSLEGDRYRGYSEAMGVISEAVDDFQDRVYAATLHAAAREGEDRE